MKHSHGEMDMVHVVSPAQLGDGFLVAHLQDERGSARIIVDGDTCIRHGKDAYHSWKEFPDILKGIILENPDHFRDVHPEYDVIRQGRFLLSVSDPDGRTRQTRTCECAGMSADQLRDMLEAELEEGGFMTTENEKLLFEAYKEARMTDEEARLSVLAADDCMVLCGGYIVVHDRLPIVTSVMELFHLYGAAHDTGKKVSDIIKDGGSRFLESYNLERFFSEWREGDNGKMWLIPAKGQRLAYLVPGSEEDIRRAYGSMRAIELSENDYAIYFQHRAEAETRFRLRLEKLLPQQKK